MSVCTACEQELLRGPCRAEEFRPIYNRAGRHGGRCWGGAFPRSKDYPAAAATQEDELQDERDREQLRIWDDET